MVLSYTEIAPRPKEVFRRALLDGSGTPHGCCGDCENLKAERSVPYDEDEIWKECFCYHSRIVSFSTTRTCDPLRISAIVATSRQIREKP